MRNRRGRGTQALIERQWAGLEGWQWLFIVEGAPAMVLGAVVFCVLADTPSTTPWLSVREQMLAHKRIPASRTVSCASTHTRSQQAWLLRFRLRTLCATCFTRKACFHGVF